MTREARAVLAAALVARLAVVAWAAGAFPPAADGTYYDVLARRLAEGHGYTWLWPDGVVTHAAHYPVGYPALLALPYAVFGARPLVAMLVNAVLGAVGVLAVHDVLVRSTRPRLALVGALVFALHPALLAYTPALMTEGVTASLLAMALAATMRAREAASARGTWTWVALTGLALGVATLVRPPSILFAPFLGALALPRPGLRRSASGAAAVTALALALCAPWTLRNCARMDRCALVSVNGGWNLLIGAQTETGAWQELKVPEPCREVFAEAAKDACFEREAKKDIAAAPLAWLARAPSKLHATFDYLGAAPWYLRESNGGRFSDAAKTALGAVETAVVRVLLLGALAAAALLHGPRARARRALAAMGAVASLTLHGAWGYVALALTLALLGPRALARAPVVVPAAGLAVVVTAAVHAAFFGAGRYGLVVVPFVTALAFVRRAEEPSAGLHHDQLDVGKARAGGRVDHALHEERGDVLIDR